VARLVYDYVWHAVPIAGVPFTAIQNRLGCLNTEYFDGLPPYTLMFASAKIRPYRSAFGMRIADVGYRFIFRPNFDSVDGYYYGWHAMLRVLDGRLRYYRVSTDGFCPAAGAGGEPTPLEDFRAPFRGTTFGPLFHPDQG
jgi:hypothetical protein